MEVWEVEPSVAGPRDVDGGSTGRLDSDWDVRQRLLPPARFLLPNLALDDVRTGSAPRSWMADKAALKTKRAGWRELALDPATVAPVTPPRMRPVARKARPGPAGPRTANDAAIWPHWGAQQGGPESAHSGHGTGRAKK